MILELSEDCFPKLARWIHSELTEADFERLLVGRSAAVHCRERNADQAIGAASAIHELRLGSLRMAAAYFNILAGSVASLGGVRAEIGGVARAGELIRQLATRLRSSGIAQIQAVSARADKATEAILHCAGFRQLTQVQHQWLNLNDLPLVPARPTIRGGSSLRCAAKLRWVPAKELPRQRLAKVICQTFEGTLDCPAINGLRSDIQVLDGMLSGLDFRRVSNWDVLEADGQLVGCVLLNLHSNQTYELVYMGICPDGRGRGSGHLLVAHALEMAAAANAQIVVLAVDCQNLPALSLYRKFGFQPHDEFSVWLA